MENIFISITDREFVENCTKHGFNGGRDTPDNIEELVAFINLKYGLMVEFYSGASAGTCDYRPVDYPQNSVEPSEVDRVNIMYYVPKFKTAKVATETRITLAKVEQPGL